MSNLEINGAITGKSLTTDSLKIMSPVSDVEQDYTLVADTDGNTYKRAMSEVSNNINKWTLLWKNSAPNTSFAAQTITVDLENYNTLVLIFKYWTTSSSYRSPRFIPITEELFGTTCSIEEVDSSKAIDRVITINKQSIVFGDCTDLSTSKVDNTKFIPLFIYGN